MRKLLCAALCLLWAALAQAQTVTTQQISGPTAWTPTDTSGAALTFTAVGANYTKAGSLVSAWLTLTFPSTANGANVSIGPLPFTVATGTVSQTPALCFSTVAIIVLVTPVANTTNFVLSNASTGASLTNANLSLARINCLITYPSS